MNFGDYITINAKLSRKIAYLTNFSKGYSTQSERKFWEKLFIEPQKGIFLGYRTLSDGCRLWDSESGYEYKPLTHYKVALVATSPKENPIYVPLENIL